MILTKTYIYVVSREQSDAEWFPSYHPIESFKRKNLQKLLFQNRKTQDFIELIPLNYGVDNLNSV